jgi:hypothetical protein
MWRPSIRSKILLVLLLTGLLCLAAGGIIGYRVGDRALTRSVEERLTALREIKRQRLDAYINNQLRTTRAVGGAPETVEATQAFITAFREMRAEVASNQIAAHADSEARQNLQRSSGAGSAVAGRSGGASSTGRLHRPQSEPGG